jgi:hypothetical protein
MNRELLNERHRGGNFQIDQIFDLQFDLKKLGRNSWRDFFRNTVEIFLAKIDALLLIVQQPSPEIRRYGIGQIVPILRVIPNDVYGLIAESRQLVFVALLKRPKFLGLVVGEREVLADDVEFWVCTSERNSAM